MDKLTNYRSLIKKILTDYVELDNSQPTPGVETFVIFDEERDHYIWFNLGWTKERRVKAITVYIRLREGKIWIEDDWTEDGITLELLRAGVPKEDIVLGFQPPEMRQYTDFAVA